MKDFTVAFPNGYQFSDEMLKKGVGLPVRDSKGKVIGKIEKLERTAIGIEATFKIPNKFDFRRLQNWSVSCEVKPKKN